jgi:hypothetical protein
MNLQLHHRRRSPVKHNTIWTAGALIVIGSVCVMTVTTAGQDRPGERRPAEPPQRDQSFPKAVVDTHELMNLFNKPAYKELTSLLSQENATLDSDQWMKVSNEAHRVSEIANLIAIRDDASEFKQWNEHAQQLQQSAMVLAKAADQRNDMEVRNAFRAMVGNCNACHQSTKPDEAPMLEPFRPNETMPSRPRTP